MNPKSPVWPGQMYNTDCVQQSVKDGGSSLIVWSCIWDSGVEDFVKIDSIKKTEKYGQILIHQHGNDFKHIVTAVKAYIDRKTQSGAQSVVDWPPQSPDINVTKAV